jgi:hypothetical protein
MDAIPRLIRRRGYAKWEDKIFCNYSELVPERALWHKFLEQALEKAAKSPLFFLPM